MKSDFFKNIEFKKGQPEAGKLLISEPFMFDENFKRSVILLTEHTEEGSVGFILNRPTEYKVIDVLGDFPNPNIDLYFGGPVGKESLFFIHSLGDKIEGSQEILPGVFWGGDFERVKELLINGEAQEEDVRFFIGYSGWAEGQLEFELEERSWIMAKMAGELVMKSKDKSFWKSTLAGMGDKYKILASFPEDPSKN